VARSRQGRAEKCTSYTLFGKLSILGTRRIYDHTLDRLRLVSNIAT